MQNTAFKITGVAVVVSALGFLSRWLQNMQMYDENGLPIQGAGISTWVILLIALTAAGLAAAALALRRYPAPETPEDALARHSFLYVAVGLAAALILFVSGCAMVWKADEFLIPALRRVLGLTTAAAAVCVARIAMGKKGQSHGAEAVVLVLFACFWLVVVYKENSGAPAVWSFAAEILAGCSAITAFYFMAGYWLSKPKPYVCIFFCLLTMFLCAMCIIDNHSAADSLAYTAMALLFGLWGFTLTENLHKPDSKIQFKL